MVELNINDERALCRGINGEFRPKKVRARLYRENGELRVLLRWYSQRRGQRAPMVLDLLQVEYNAIRQQILEELAHVEPAEESRFELLRQP